MFKDLFPTLSFKCTVKWKTEARKHAFRHSNLTRKNKFSFETMEFSRPENRAPEQPPPRRKILQLLQKDYATVGIYPNRESFNLRVIIRHTSFVIWCLYSSKLKHSLITPSPFLWARWQPSQYFFCSLSF